MDYFILALTFFGCLVINALFYYQSKEGSKQLWIKWSFKGLFILSIAGSGFVLFWIIMSLIMPTC
jgi:hypothetical protein